MVFGFPHMSRVPTREQDEKSWQRGVLAIELSLGEADTAKLRSIAQSRTEPASRVERARILLAYREDPSFFAVGLHSGCIIKQSSAASSAPWPKARWLRWMIALAPVESRRSLPRPRHGWCRWHAGRRRNLAIPTNCGQRGFWPATLASMDPRRDMRASPTSPRHSVQDPRPGRGETAQSAILPGTARSRLC